MDDELKKRPRKIAKLEKSNGEYVIDSNLQSCRVPCFNVSSTYCSKKIIENAFSTYQVVHLTNISKERDDNAESNGNDDDDIVASWKDIGNLFHSLNKDDQESWCLETVSIGNIDPDDNDSKKQKNNPTSQEFLKPEIIPSNHTSTAYCSFLVQKDKAAYTKFLQRLPVKEIPTLQHWKYEPCLWIFFGRNSSKTDLCGRPEHTDAISHDGTWHFQLSGTKKWLIRPTQQLLGHLRQQLSSEEVKERTESTRVQVMCHVGDIIMINTRLWKHQTHIPPQPNPSVSYARDFWTKSNGHPSKGNDYATTSCTMTNLDGLYATNDIETGTIIFREADMPDCELHRSATNANCEVVELDDGTNAVVSTRPIPAGDFFCVPETSDEEEEEDEDCEGEEYEEVDDTSGG